MKDRSTPVPPTESCSSAPPQTVSPTLVILIFALSFLWTGLSPLPQESFKAMVEPGYFCSSRWPLLQAGRIRCRNCSHSQSCAHALCVHVCAHSLCSRVRVCACARVCVHMCTHSLVLELFIHQLLWQGLLPISSLPGPFSRCPQHPGGCLPGREAPSGSLPAPSICHKEAGPRKEALPQADVGAELDQASRHPTAGPVPTPRPPAKPPGTPQPARCPQPRPPAMEVGQRAGHGAGKR